MHPAGPATRTVIPGERSEDPESIEGHARIRKGCSLEWIPEQRGCAACPG